MISSLDDPYEGVFVCISPDEIEEIAIRCGLEKIYNISTDGLVYAIGERLNAANEEHFQKYMEYHYSICEEQNIIGASLHGLWIGRKP